MFYSLITATVIDQPQKSCSTRSKNTKNAILTEKLLFESILPISSFLFLVETQSYNDSKIKETINGVVFEGMHFMLSKKIGEVKDDDSNDSEENCVCGEIIKGSKEQENGETLGDHVEHVLNCGCVDPKIEETSNSEMSDIDSESKYENVQEKKDDIVLDTKKQPIDAENPEKSKKNTLTTKKEVLDLLDLYSNFSLKIDIENDKIKAALEKRNKMFESDKSQISKLLCKDEIKKMKTQVSLLDENAIKKILNVKKIEKKNKKYIRIIKTLRRTITETENLTKAIEREKSEFVREFIAKKHLPESKEQHETKISFNLAGSIFAPNVFLQMINDISMVKKDEFIEKSVKGLLQPIKSLELYIKLKSNTEKKEEIIKFLLACLEKRNNVFFESIDEAFKIRSNVISLYFANIQGKTKDKKISVIDQYQEQYIKKILRFIKERNEDFLENFIITDDQVVDAYAKFLRLNTKDAKKKLYELF
ncbi:hypothetical protein BDAP_000995 [Binucleata daphniae]